MTRLYVIPCSGAKLPHAAPAGELYTGSWHRLARQAADALAAREGGEVQVLSALHGLLQLDAVVEPYNVTIRELERRPRPGELDAHPGGSRELGERVARQLIAAGATEAVALLPGAYLRVLEHAALRVWVAKDVRLPVIAPLVGLTGVGYQRQRLSELRDGSHEVLVPN
jgi:hypothetical protein